MKQWYVELDKLGATPYWENVRENVPIACKNSIDQLICFKLNLQSRCSRVITSTVIPHVLYKLPAEAIMHQSACVFGISRKFII